MKAIVKTLLIAGFVCCASLAHADKTVTFNVPVKLEKLDPAVKAAFIYCAIQGPNNFNIIDHGPFITITNGGFVGVTAVPVTIKDADLGKVKTWTCYLRLNVIPSESGAMGLNVAGKPWTQVAPGAVSDANGTF